LSRKVKYAVSTPATVGAKATLTVQVAAGANAAGQLLPVRINWFAFVDSNNTPVIVSGTVPVLVMVTGTDPLTVATAWGGKVGIEEGMIFVPGVAPVSLR